MKQNINLHVEFAKNGKVLDGAEIKELKKSNPSKEELDKLGVKITQEF